MLETERPRSFLAVAAPAGLGDLSWARTELRLLAAARQGDRAAFDLLLDHYRPTLARFCSQAADTAEDGDDLFQNIALRAWRGIGAFRGEAAFGTWLYRIARNEYADLLSRRRRAPLPLERVGAQSADGEELPARELADGAPGPESAFLQNDFARFLLESARAVCAPREFAALLLCYQGSAPGQIASLLGVSEPLARQLTFRGREKLLAHLLLHHPETVGGREALRKAFETAQRNAPGAPLLEPEEERVFSATALDGAPVGRRREVFRRAAMKVARFLSL